MCVCGGGGGGEWGGEKGTGEMIHLFQTVGGWGGGGGDSLISKCIEQSDQ